MSLSTLVQTARDITRFTRVEHYIEFCRRFLDFVAVPENLQATIVSQNEAHYRFYQYNEEGHYNISRPLNSRLMYSAEDGQTLTSFPDVLELLKGEGRVDERERSIVRRSIYTLQQAIGISLDALPAGQSNVARKINGDLFERLIQLLISHLGVPCEGGIVRVPVTLEGVEQFRMNYQHDLIIKEHDVVKAIGSVKTSSKDRLDKVFVDKFLYARLTGNELPHFAIFLHDVQRKNVQAENRYGISATFLPGHFKGYTLKLNPLDGVYYCDIRPNMTTDALLSSHIRTIDHFFATDLWDFVQRRGDPDAVVEPESR